MCELIYDFTHERLNDLVENNIMNTWFLQKTEEFNIHDDTFWDSWITKTLCINYSMNSEEIITYNQTLRIPRIIDILPALINNIKGINLYYIIEHIHLVYSHIHSKCKQNKNLEWEYFISEWKYYYYKYIYGNNVNIKRKQFIMRHYAFSHAIYCITEQISGYAKKHNRIRNLIIVSGNKKINVDN